jgi:diacylglycerol kinase (ATP)
MRVALLVNPTSGRGRGERIAEVIARALREAGHDVAEALVGRGRPSGPIEAALRRADAAVIAGGDGTLHHATPQVQAVGAAVYHVPLGTENLFARHFGMKADARMVVRALAAPSTAIDVAALTIAPATGTTEPLRRQALLMLGIGPDGGIVRDIAARRRGPISHATYIAPSLRQLGTPSLPRLTIEVDGKRVVDSRRGWLIVANCREYGGRLDPCGMASMRDGALDIVFLPAESGVSAAVWAARALTRSLDLGLPMLGRAVRCAGALVRVTSADEDPAWQVDGEHGEATRGAFEAVVRVMPGALRVLGVPRV